MTKRIALASDGVEIYTETHGEGGAPPVLFSCAYCTTHENWRPQVEPLCAAGARVLLWDYRGHGLSGAPEKDDAFSLDQALSDMERVLDQNAPDERVVLAGLSFGGLLSLHFTLRWPERVRALLLVDSGPGFKKPEAQQGWLDQIERTATFLETRGLRAFVDGKAGVTCIGRKPELPAAKAAGDAIAAQDPRAVARFGRRIAGPATPIIDDLAGIEQPALVIVGAEDKPYLRAADVMEAKLPNAEKWVIPEVGHIANLEATEAFNERVAEFLRDLA